MKNHSINYLIPIFALPYINDILFVNKGTADIIYYIIIVACVHSVFGSGLSIQGNVALFFQDGLLVKNYRWSLKTGYN